ncbi:MAG: hypothetical protein P8L20_06200 [Flavobacteriales bacterium]|nr:hypothetical protein [Flavobacteriales bacterium]
MIKIEIPLKKNPNSMQRKMAGIAWMRYTSIAGHQKIVSSAKLRELLLDKLEDYEGEIAIHNYNELSTTPLFSMEINPNNYSSMTKLIQRIEREYLRYFQVLIRDCD